MINRDNMTVASNKIEENKSFPRKNNYFIND